ncbi:hypothetical protein HK103_006157 [Boothiomyces macroporosus]|uniref:Uncharacterized protein n=1 Tax=Boothiomyces macroporosus TaxID=261099 RepID=A0AAD5Y4U6_9FUNG|nr:hypothetical protein HK103_006157 [Boothiomyces macroporosus]
MSLIKRSLRSVKTRCFINKLILERSLLETDNEEFKNGEERFTQLQGLVQNTISGYKSLFTQKELKLLGKGYKEWNEVEKAESAKRWESMCALYSSLGLVKPQPLDKKLNLKEVLLVYNRLPAKDSVDAHIDCFDGKLMDESNFKIQVLQSNIRAQLHEVYTALNNSKNDPRYNKAVQENRQMIAGLVDFAKSNNLLAASNIVDNDIVIDGEKYEDINQEKFGQLYNAAEYRLSAYNWICGNDWDFDEFVPFITL